MTTEEAGALLRTHFNGLNDSALRIEILEAGRLHSFNAGDVIMDYGSYVRMVPLVISGRIKVLREDEDGNELLLYYLNPGETCTMSFSCCMAQKKSVLRTVAEEDTMLIGLPIDVVDRWMTKYPAWKNYVLQAYDDRMIELIHTIDGIAFKGMDERLWDYLLTKAGLTEEYFPDRPVSTHVHVTHQEIANDLHASREAISRLLKKLERDGKIELGRNEIVIL